MEPAVSLVGAVALVTGASSGIGRAVACALAARGAIVLLAGRDAARLNETRDLIANSEQVFTIEMDLESDVNIHNIRVTVNRYSSRLDIIIHCAGWITLGSLSTLSGETLDRHYRINTRAPLLLTQALLPLLIKAQGQIVFINSSVGINIKTGVGAYAASKHALRALADTLRAEINAEGVRVTSIYPGNTATPMQSAIQSETGSRVPDTNLLQPDDIAATVLHVLSLPRTAEVTDIHIRPFRKPPAP